MVAVALATILLMGTVQSRSLVNQMPRYLISDTTLSVSPLHTHGEQSGQARATTGTGAGARGERHRHGLRRGCGRALASRAKRSLTYDHNLALLLPSSD